MSEQAPDLNKAFAQLGRAIQDTGQAIAVALGKWMEQAAPAMQAFYAAMYARYREAGAPYGENHEGLMRWVREVGEAQRLEWEAQRILERHETLATSRRRLGT
jgi:hypothetical protein